MRYFPTQVLKYLITFHLWASDLHGDTDWKESASDEELVYSHLLSQDVDIVSHLPRGNLHPLTLIFLIVELLYHLHLHTHVNLYTTYNTECRGKDNKDENKPALVAAGWTGSSLHSRCRDDSPSEPAAV